MTTLRTSLATFAVIGLACVSTASLADGPQATATAARHAGLAAAAEDMAGAMRHLHHTLNCLVGPDGAGFDAGAGNPCNEAGGAIPQTADAMAKSKLEGAATQVRSALGNSDLAAVKQTAMAVQHALE